MADSAAAIWRLDDLAAATRGYWCSTIEPEHPDGQVISQDVLDRLQELPAGREHHVAWMIGGFEPRLASVA